MEMTVLQNILVMIIIFLICGILNALFIFTALKIFFLTTIVGWPFCVVVVQVCAIVLDPDLYKIVCGILVCQRSTPPSAVAFNLRRRI